MRPILVWVVLAAATATLSGCSSDTAFKTATPSNIAGNYTLTITNGDNGCMLENWESGKSTASIPFVITQDGSNANGTLQGAAAVVLGLFIGTNQFTGSVSASDFVMTAYGTIPRHQDMCAYNLNARVTGSIAGDAISGTIDYAPATSTNPACMSVQCTSTQSFNGTRPPP